MTYIPSGTLRAYLAIPQVMAKDMGKLALPDVAKRVKKYRHDSYEVSPDQEALEFYCMNHLASVIQANFDKDEKLPPWACEVMEKYVDVLVKQSQRMFSYMLLIISREARHVSSSSMYSDWMTKFPEDFRKFLKSIQDSDASVAVNAICDKAPKMEVGKFTEAIVTVFNKGKWGGGFGGKPWANIAKCLSKAVNGETSLELMVDSAYSLAHNNGPMFNKGMLYGHYTGEFIKILDVQRSGQIPELVQDGGSLNSVSIPGYLGQFVAKVRAEFPNAFGTYVDWNKVESLGSKGHYSAEKKMMPKGQKKPVKMDGKLVVEVGTLFVMPGQAVTQFKRVAA